MNKKMPPSKPKQAQESREDRLKSALKANMARRKAQARARQVQDGGQQAGPAGQNTEDSR